MSRIFTGAKAKVKIGEQVVGFASGVNVTQEDTLTEVAILGQLDAADLAETGHKVSFTLNVFKAFTNEADNPQDGVPTSASIKNTAAELGILNASITTESLAADRNRSEISVEIIDDTSPNEEPIYKMVGCKCEGGSGQVDANGLWQGTWNFKARRGFGL